MRDSTGEAGIPVLQGREDEVLVLCTDSGYRATQQGECVVHGGDACLRVYCRATDEVMARFGDPVKMLAAWERQARPEVFCSYTDADGTITYQVIVYPDDSSGNLHDPADA